MRMKRYLHRVPNPPSRVNLVTRRGQVVLVHNDC
jgi:hypothetical protein